MIASVAARLCPFNPPRNCKWFVAVPNSVAPLSSTVRSQSAFHSRRSSWDHAVALRLRSHPKPEMRVAAANRAADVIAVSQSILETKNKLYKAVEGIDRGIFGASSEKKSEIEGLVELLESQNPILCPTDHLSRVDGCWKLVYSTISILGSKRTKLGLRGFITLGDFLQTISVSKAKAVNEIKFYVRGFTKFSGKLVVTASFKISSKSRVDIKFEEASISPDELMNLFQKNYVLLLAIFNPDGWLEITYVDDSLRIGRDDQGNIFVLEKWQGS